MQPFLIFCLTANLGAMGELAGHERRGALTFPGRSAVIGLMAAALGIRREGDFSALEALEMVQDQAPGVLPGLLDALLEGARVRGRRVLRGRDGAVLGYALFKRLEGGFVDVA